MRRRRRPPIVWLVAFVFAAAVATGVALIGSRSKTSGVASRAGQVRPVTVIGRALPAFVPTAERDPATGRAAPTLEGADFQGRKIVIAPGRAPLALMFVAHWCPHCQREVPRLHAWLTAHALPGGLRLYIVPTGTSPDRSNYPPQAWLDASGLAGVPTLVDSANSDAANAYGLTVYPFIVLVGRDGKVAGRASGEGLDFDGMFTALVAGRPIRLRSA
jgi:cytochrome c biogenesis protein CcmG/thiol:disulfide interchange protein DsbE